MKNRFFLIPQMIFALVSSFFLMVFTKSEIHILLNSYNSQILDFFFKLVTNLGNGFLYIAVVPFLLTRKLKWVLVFIIAVVISNLFLFMLKHVLFDGMYRPAKYFELYETYRLHLVKGVKLHDLNSFPSGHTTTAFTIFMMLTMLTRKNIVKLSLFLLAFLTAYSRVYLSQHFLIDIVAGSVIGSGSVILATVFSERFKKSQMEKTLINLPKRIRREERSYTEKSPGIVVS